MTSYTTIITSVTGPTGPERTTIISALPPTQPSVASISSAFTSTSSVAGQSTVTVTSTTPPIFTDTSVSSTLPVSSNGTFSSAPTSSSLSAVLVSSTYSPSDGVVVFTGTITPTTAGPTSAVFTVPVRATQASKSTGISGGAIGGAVIGGLIAGAIIGAIVMLVLGKKKQRRSRSSGTSAYGNAPSGHGPVEAVAGRSKEKAAVTTTATDPDYLLPQPKDDQSMGATANQLFVHIGNHVENFYHNNPLNITPQSEEEGLLISRKTRHFAIKRLICREMLAAIAWDCKPAENSLLSAAAVSMAQGMSRGNLDESTYEVAWSRWHVSTALLLAKEDGGQKARARKFWVDRLQHKLQPFQIDNSETLAAIREDLHAICNLAEKLASVICSQPGRFEFLWPRGDSRGQMVIFPEFARLTDNKGRGLDRPRQLLEAQRMQ